MELLTPPPRESTRNQYGRFLDSLQIHPPPRGYCKFLNKGLVRVWVLLSDPESSSETGEFGLAEKNHDGWVRSYTSFMGRGWGLTHKD